jgi:hypothetical protein
VWIRRNYDKEHLEAFYNECRPPDRQPDQTWGYGADAQVEEHRLMAAGVREFPPLD